MDGTIDDLEPARAALEHHRRRAAAVEVDPVLGSKRAQPGPELARRHAGAISALTTVDDEEVEDPPTLRDAGRGTRVERTLGADGLAPLEQEAAAPRRPPGGRRSSRLWGPTRVRRPSRAPKPAAACSRAWRRKGGLSVRARPPLGETGAGRAGSSGGETSDPAEIASPAMSCGRFS